MEIIRNFFGHIIEMLGDWPLGTFVATLIILFVLVLIGAILYGLFTAADSWFLQRKNKEGLLIGKTFIPAHTTYTTNPIYHSDEWSVIVDVDGERGSLSVSRKFYNSLTEDDSLTVSYVSGRMTGRLYVKSITRR